MRFPGVTAADRLIVAAGGGGGGRGGCEGSNGPAAPVEMVVTAMAMG
ncbi:MAG: hypothetical protein IPI66_00980 [Chitinophagaceae bacterium]|nr:hypothetical protein [Chitinophagaceae bacterium]